MAAITLQFSKFKWCERKLPTQFLLSCKWQIVYSTYSSQPKFNWNSFTLCQVFWLSIYLYFLIIYGHWFEPVSSQSNVCFQEVKSWMEKGGDWGHCLFEKKLHIYLFLFFTIRISCSEYYVNNTYFEVYIWQSHGIHQHQIRLNTVSIRVQSGEILIKQHKLFLGLRVWTWDLPCKCCYILKESYQWCPGCFPPTNVSLSKPIHLYS